MSANVKTASSKWLDRVSSVVKKTPKGVRLDVSLYVYPDAHGNFYFRRAEDGKLDDPGQPVNGIEEAVEVFREIWDRATAQAADGKPS